MNDVNGVLLRHRAGRSAGGRSAPAVGLRRITPTGGEQAGTRGHRPDASGHGPRPRSVPAAGRRAARRRLERPGSLLRRRGRGDAADPGGTPAAQAEPQGRWPPSRRRSYSTSSWPAPNHAWTCWPWTRPWPSSNSTTHRAGLVELRFFAGLTIAEAAQALGVSEVDGRQRLGLHPLVAPPGNRGNTPAGDRCTVDAPLPGVIMTTTNFRRSGRLQCRTPDRQQPGGTVSIHVRSLR